MQRAAFAVLVPGPHQPDGTGPKAQEWRQEKALPHEATKPRAAGASQSRVSWGDRQGHTGNSATR